MQNLLKAFFEASRESSDEIMARISKVKLGPIVGNEETVRFDFDGKPYVGVQRGRNRDAVIGLSEETDKGWVLRMILDGDTTIPGTQR
jgi:hypothetical protein